MKILFVWTGVTSYMADCWQELARREGIELKVVIIRHSSGSEIDASLLFGNVNVDIVDDGCRLELGAWRPDVIFAVGWHSRTVRMTVADSRLACVPKVCCFDMPWRWMLRCIVARWVLARYLSNFTAAYVPGSAAARYARWLGFDRIYTGLFSLDSSRFPSEAGKSGFMYIGRHAPEKRLDIIRRAYDRYREMGGTWAMDVYGGVNFVQPSEIPSLYSRHACLLLASSFDPWPLVMLEATVSGLMVIASDRCGNVDELGAFRVPYGNPDVMATAMLKAERGEISPPGRILATDYDCGVWANRVLGICDELVGK